MSYSSLNRLVSRFRREIELYKLLILHPSCPRLARICLGAAIVYALSPIDLIPDFIPVIGHLDDAVILPLLVYIALRSVPEGLIEEVRAQLSD